MKNLAELQLETVAGTGMRFSVQTDSARFALENGRGLADPSPMQAVLGAIGGCTGMDVISILRKMRQEVTAYEIEVRADRAEEHPKVFTAVEVVHRFRGVDLKPASIERAIELSETRYCSVHAMLAPTVRMSSRYEILPAETAAA